jgi:hypothetical protein
MYNFVSQQMKALSQRDDMTPEVALLHPRRRVEAARLPV